MHITNPKVDEYIGRVKQWRDETARLRSILLGLSLTEELKWGKPCYAYEGGNVVIIQGFKDYCALLFFKGALLKDPDGILVKTGENTIVGRQIRFTSVREIDELEASVIAYVNQAIDVEKSGAKLEAAPGPDLVYPTEFQSKLNANPAIKAAFESLTPGRKKAYIIFFASAKQSATREARIDKWLPQILAGKGMHD